MKRIPLIMGSFRIGHCLFCCFLLVYTNPLQAQLAITEVMSSAALNCGGISTSGNADFWEITNFGNTPINLKGYVFIDLDKLFPGPDEPWKIPEIIIGARESIVFVRTQSGTADEAAFRSWWGAQNLPLGLRVYFYPKNYGFSSTLDGVRLWDSNTNLLDQVHFGEAIRGRTFTYDPVTGEF